MAKPSADPVAESVVAPVVQAVPVVAETSAPAFTTDDIARLAYSYWEARGYQGGSPEEDWLRAEAELRSQSLATKL